MAWCLSRGAQQATRGSQLACEAGRLGLAVEGQTWVLEEGDVRVFRGDQKHGYSNEGDGDSIGWSVVLLTPIGPGQEMRGVATGPG